MATTDKSYTCTFCSLPDGTWGVRVVGLSPVECSVGLVLTATKRNGDVKQVEVRSVVLVKGDAIVCSIADTRKVSSYRGRGGYSRPRSYEQASRASQSAPYDLAPTQANDLAMTRAYEARQAAQANGYVTRVEPAAEVQAKVEAAGTEDLAALFSSLLAQPSLIDGGESTLRKQ